MSNTSFRRLALSGHQSPPLCGPDNLTRCLAGAKPIRQTRPSRNPLALGHQLPAKPMHRSMTTDANPDRSAPAAAGPLPLHLGPPALTPTAIRGSHPEVGEP